MRGGKEGWPREGLRYPTHIKHRVRNSVCVIATLTTGAQCVRVASQNVIKLAVLPKLQVHFASTRDTHTHHSLVSIVAHSSVLIVQCTVDVRTVVEGPAPPLYRPPPPLVHEMPVETGEWSVLVALVLEEGLALLNSELLQISREENNIISLSFS